MDQFRRWIAKHTNSARLDGSLKEVLAGADVFIGVSAPGLLTGEDIATVAPKAIVFALVNPVPEVDAVEASKHSAVVATGRSDYPNQINNVLVFPGFFRGLLDAGVSDISDEMLIAAAKAIADTVKADELNPATSCPASSTPAWLPPLPPRCARWPYPVDVRQRHPEGFRDILRTVTMCYPRLRISFRRAKPMPRASTIVIERPGGPGVRVLHRPSQRLEVEAGHQGDCRARSAGARIDYPPRSRGTRGSPRPGRHRGHRLRTAVAVCLHGDGSSVRVSRVIMSIRARAVVRAAGRWG